MAAEMEREVTEIGEIQETPSAWTTLSHVWKSETTHETETRTSKSAMMTRMRRSAQDGHHERACHDLGLAHQQGHLDGDDLRYAENMSRSGWPI
jgi:dTDP-4-amino-4,6-dideoxygalactose transaminase